MATSSAFRFLKQPDDITECQICSKQLIDPRSLPCMHTYCLKCLENYCHETNLAYCLSCPSCGNETKIPADGLSGLHRNNFLANLQARKRISFNLNEPGNCDVCEAAGVKNVKKKVAKSYCLDCLEKYCDVCASCHRFSKATRSHQQMNFDESAVSRETLRTAAPRWCDKHSDQKVNVFCGDCKTAICFICYIALHKEHKCSDVADVVNGFRKQLETDIQTAVEGANLLGEMTAVLTKQKVELEKQVVSVEGQITQTVEEFQRLIENDKNGLIQELRDKKEAAVQKMEMLMADIEQRAELMKNVRKYCEQLLNNGGDSDIAQETNLAHQRVLELSSYDDFEHARNEMGSTAVNFSASSLTRRSSENLIGTVDVRFYDAAALLLPMPVLTHVLTKKGKCGQIVGVTRLAGELYVVRQRAGPNIEVYDAEFFKLIRNIPVPGLTEAHGLASCGVHKCLYVSGFDSSSVYRVSVRDSAAALRTQAYGAGCESYSGVLATSNVTTWEVGPQPTGISVNRSSNVIVTSQGACQLEVYTTTGQAVRTIGIQSVNSACLWYALQLQNGLFAVSHNDGILLIEANAEAAESDRKGSGLIRAVSVTSKPLKAQLSSAAGILQTNNGHIIVADHKDDRILVFNQAFNRSGELPLPPGVTLQTPWALCYDESQGRLYVGEKLGSRVLVFDKVTGLNSD